MSDLVLKVDCKRKKVKNYLHHCAYEVPMMKRKGNKILSAAILFISAGLAMSKLGSQASQYSKRSAKNETV